MSDERQRFHFLYNFEPKPEAIRKEEIPEGWGACDAMLAVSIVYPPDGGFSIMLLPLDGRVPGEALSDREMFKVWAMMSKRLAESSTLGEYGRSFAQMVWETWTESLTRAPEDADV